MTVIADAQPEIRSKGFFTAHLSETDPEVYAAVRGELAVNRTRSS